MLGDVVWRLPAPQPPAPRGAAAQQVLPRRRAPPVSMPAQLVQVAGLVGVAYTGAEQGRDHGPCRTSDNPHRFHRQAPIAGPPASAHSFPLDWADATG